MGRCEHYWDCWLFGVWQIDLVSCHRVEVEPSVGRDSFHGTQLLERGSLQC